MKSKAFKNISIIFLFCMFCFSIISYAHPGRTDSKGGHHDTSNGTYHYHHGYSAHQHPNGICPYEAVEETTARSSTVDSVSNKSSLSPVKPNTNTSTASSSDLTNHNLIIAESYILVFVIFHCLYFYKKLQRTLALNKQTEKTLASTQVDLDFQIQLSKNLQNQIQSLDDDIIFYKKTIASLKHQISQYREAEEPSFVLSQQEAFKIAQVPIGVSFDEKNLPHYYPNDNVEKNMHVYVSKNGKRYHRIKGCCQATIPLHLFIAAQFYSPCKCCIPQNAQNYQTPLWYYKYLQLTCNCKIVSSSESNVRYQLKDLEDESINILSE